MSPGVTLPETVNEDLRGAVLGAEIAIALVTPLGCVLVTPLIVVFIVLEVIFPTRGSVVLTR